MKKLFVLISIIGGFATMNSCNTQDACQDVKCFYDGQCVNGDCECLNGLTGPNCEIGSLTNGVLVVHEGGFEKGNASISFLLKDVSVAANGVFSTVNTVPLGDVAQSMTIIGNRGYIAVNNSAKVEVVNMDDFRSVGTITGLSSPRFIVRVSDEKAYVSDLFSGSITVFNPQTLNTTGAISVIGQVEEMVSTASGIIAAGSGANQVYRIDTSTNQLSDSVAVGIGPSQLAVDANGKVWVLTNGGWGAEAPKLVRINPADMSVELSLDFTLTDFPSSLKTNAAKTSLYWANGGVFQMDITATSIPTTAFISTAVYKINANPQDDIIYVSDAGDFNSNGKVYSYNPDGTAVDTFNVGVIPAELVFTQ